MREELINLTDAELEELARKKRNEYHRNWRKNNPDKVKQYNQNYWLKRALKEESNKV